jgi:hypothetical protein
MATRFSPSAGYLLIKNCMVRATTPIKNIKIVVAANPGMYLGASVEGHKNTPYIEAVFPKALVRAMATARFCAGAAMTLGTHCIHG